jgi:hypothetical protein
MTIGGSAFRTPVAGGAESGVASGRAILPLRRGAIAQLEERLNGIQKVRGSSPLSSTNPRKLPADTATIHDPQPERPGVVVHPGAVSRS